MLLPFSRSEFLQVFVAYNDAIWPGQIVATAAGLLVMGLLFWRPAWAVRVIAGILAAFWLMTGIGYHWTYFAAINPAAQLFGGLFALQAAIFLVEGTVRGRISFKAPTGLRGWAAVALMLYAAVIYPLIGLFLSHPYPQTPLFGVTPCPTTIFTIGTLVLAQTRRPLLLAAIPLIWSMIGSTAALYLNMPEDFGLPAAAAVWLAAYLAGRRGAEAH